MILGFILGCVACVTLVVIFTLSRPMLRLYLLTLPGKGKGVVCAAHEQLAKTIVPVKGNLLRISADDNNIDEHWTRNPEDIECVEIGTANPATDEGCVLGCLILA